MEMNCFGCRLTDWLDMASEMRDARCHMCGPGVQEGGQSEPKDGKREAPGRHEGRLGSYHFVLGRLENTNSHLVGSCATHKVTSYEHAFLTIRGKSG